MAGVSNVTTLKTIAETVGVDVSTVSRVLRNDKSCYISERKKQNIVETAKSFNYVPNYSARSLATGRAFNIGFVLCNLSHIEQYSPFIPDLLEGIHQELKKEGFKISVVAITYDDIKELESLCSMRNLYDGLIFGYSVISRKGVKAVMASGMPSLVVDSNEPILQRMSRVLTDKQDGISKVVKYLKSKGHERIAFYGYGVPMHPHEEMFKKVLLDNGLPVDDSLIFKFACEHANRAILDSFLSADKLIKNKSQCSAVFCTNDFVALGLCERMKKEGIDVGKDIDVAGFDNIEEVMGIPEKDRFLTTVRKPRRKIGVVAAKILMDMINTGSREPKKEELSCELVIRKSA